MVRTRSISAVRLGPVMKPTIAAVEVLGDDLEGLRDAGDDVRAGEKDDMERGKDRDQTGRDRVAVLEDASRLGDPELHPRDPDVGRIRMGGDLFRLGIDGNPPGAQRLRDARRLLKGALDDDRLFRLDAIDEPDQGLPGLRSRGNMEHFGGDGLGPHFEFGEEMHSRFLGGKVPFPGQHLCYS